VAERILIVVGGRRPAAWQRRVLELLAADARVEVAGVRAGRPEPAGLALVVVRAVERRLFGLGPDALAPGPVRLHEPPPEGPAPLPLYLDGEPGGDGDALWLVHGSAGGTLEERCAQAIAGSADGLRSELRLRRGGQTAVLAATVSGVRPYALTVAPNEIRWKLAGLVARSLGRLDALEAAAHAAAPPGGARPPKPRLRLPARWLRALWIRGVHRRPWQLLVRTAASDLRAGWDAPSLVGGRPGHLYADPFLIEHAGSVHLFCEEVALAEHRGVISHVDLAQPGAVPEAVLRAPHHLSYPFLLEHEGRPLMVPESASARRVELWRATNFPTRWERDSVLLDDVALADATVVEHDGRWWLFGTVAEPGASLLDELHLFLAPDLRGPWTSHPGNPVVSDARCARPAGPIFRRGGRLVRPAQDGGRRYGGALVLQEITTLTPTAYAERPLERIDPRDVPGARAVHHLSATAGFEAIDIRVRKLRLRAGATRRIGAVDRRLRGGR